MHENSAFEGDEEFFATVFFAILGADRKTMQYVSAGHEAAFVIGAGGATPLPATGPIIGLMDDDSAFDHHIVPLSPGRIVVVATDGFLEARNPAREFLGADALVSVIERNRDYAAERQAEAITSYAYAFAAERLHDDVAALVVNVVR